MNITVYKYYMNYEYYMNYGHYIIYMLKYSIAYISITIHFQVRLICMICDAPQRQECKGIKSHNGYYACERCVIKGTWIEGAGVRWLELGKRPRTDEFWERYKRPAFGEKVCINSYVFTSNKFYLNCSITLI